MIPTRWQEVIRWLHHWRLIACIFLTVLQHHYVAYILSYPLD